MIEGAGPCLIVHPSRSHGKDPWDRYLSGARSCPFRALWRNGAEQFLDVGGDMRRLPTTTADPVSSRAIARSPVAPARRPPDAHPFDSLRPRPFRGGHVGLWGRLCAWLADDREHARTRGHATELPRPSPCASDACRRGT